jgi:ATP-binding cassette subfamily A (ABC1) protein 3
MSTGPQHDALLELLSVRQHLELFARLKGISTRHQLNQVILDKLNQLDLVSFEHKLAGSLSGGNKRKLSVAIATIGSPSVVFLDEPSTGMDPCARRFMWRVLSNLKTSGTSLILTTHSMEEAEALCDRIGIMVNGALRCLGSTTHLKNVFGRGLEIDLKVPSPAAGRLQELVHHCGRVHWDPTQHSREDALAAFTGALEQACTRVAEAAGTPKRELATTLCGSGLTAFDRDALLALTTRQSGEGEAVSDCAEALCHWWLAETAAVELDHALAAAFPAGCTLLERPSETAFRYRVSTEHREGVGLGRVFSLLEGFKQRRQIVEYSAGQTTLEQIFNQHASGQENPEVA